MLVTTKFEDCNYYQMPYMKKSCLKCHRLSKDRLRTPLYNYTKAVLHTRAGRTETVGSVYTVFAQLTDSLDRPRLKRRLRRYCELVAFHKKEKMNGSHRSEQQMWELSLSFSETLKKKGKFKKKYVRHRKTAWTWMENASVFLADGVLQVKRYSTSSLLLTATAEMKQI